MDLSHFFFLERRGRYGLSLQNFLPGYFCFFPPVVIPFIRIGPLTKHKQQGNEVISMHVCDLDMIWLFLLISVISDRLHGI